MTTQNKNFDLTAEYTAIVVPLISQLHEECTKLGLPLVVAVKYFEDDTQTGNGTAAVINERAGIRFATASQILKGNVPDMVCAMAYKLSQDEESDE